MSTRAQAVARAASRRLWARDAALAAGPSLSVSFAAGLLAVVGARLAGWTPWEWAGLVASATVGAFAAAVWATRRARSPQRAAVEIDSALGLRDRLAAGLAFEDSPGAEDPAFVDLARRGADDAAAQVRLRDAAPIRLGAWWRVWPVLASCAVAAAMFIPSQRVAGTRASHVRAQEARDAEKRDRAAEQIADARRAAERAARQADAPAATGEQLRALEDLTRELAGGNTTPEQARAKAAETVDRAAESLERSAEETERALDAMGKRLAAVDPATRTDEAREFGEALKRGDFGRAAEALDRLERRQSGVAEPGAAAEPMTPQQRERLAKDLESIAEQLNRTPDTPPPAPTDAAERARQAMEQRGADPAEAERLSRGTDQRAISDALQRGGVDPEAADRLAHDAAEHNRQRDAERRAQDKARELRDALNDAAKDSRNASPTPPAATPSPQPPAQSQPAQPPPQQQPNDPPQPEPSQPASPDRKQPEPSPGAGQTSPQPQAKPGEQQPQGGEQQQPPDAGRQPSQQPGSNPGAEPAQQPQQQPAQGEGDQPRSSPQPQPGQTPGVGQPQKPEGQSPQQEQGQGQPGSQPGAQPGGPRQQAAPDGAERQTPGQSDGQSGLQRARRAIEQMRDQQQGAAGQRRSADQMREQSRRLMERAAPDQREQAERWSRELAKEMGEPEGDGAGSQPGPRSPAGPRAESPFRTEDMDVRRRANPDAAGEQGRVAGEIDNPFALERGGVDTRAPAAVERAREAARGAERAIEDQSTPAARRRVVKEYFRRLPSAVGPGSAAPARDAADLRDAQPKPADKPAQRPAPTPAPAPAQPPAQPPAQGPKP